MALFPSKTVSDGPLSALLRRLGGDRRAPASAALDDRFREAFEQSPSGVAFVARDGHSLHVNARFRDITGYTREQLFRTSFRDLTHPDDAQKEAPLIKDLVAGEIASYKLDKRIFQKDGSYRWITVLTSAVRSKSGEVSYFVHAVEEITEKRGTEIWRGADQVLVAVVDAIDEIAIIRTDSLGTIQSWNRGATRILGFLRDEMMGRPRRVLYRDNDNWDDRPSEHLDAASSKGRLEGEDWRVSKTGAHLWLRSTLSAVRQDGRLVGFMEVLRHPDLGRALPPSTEPTVASQELIRENAMMKVDAEESVGVIEALRRSLDETKAAGEETMNDLRIMTAALRKDMDRRRALEAELKDVQEALARVTSLAEPTALPLSIVAPEEVLVESELAPTQVAETETWIPVGERPLTEVMVELAAANRIGTFTIQRGEVRREIFFDRGKILSCATNQPTAFLAQRLIEQGLVTDEQRQRALEIQQQTGLALGRILVILGFIEEEALLGVMRSKMQEELRETFTWHEAKYCFVEGATPSLQIVPLPIDVVSFIVHELLGPVTAIPATDPTSLGASIPFPSSPILPPLPEPAPMVTFDDMEFELEVDVEAEALAVREPASVRLHVPMKLQAPMERHVDDEPPPAPIDVDLELSRAIEPLLQTLAIADGELPELDLDDVVVASTTGKSRKYHLLTCSVADRIAERNRIRFGSRSDAEAGGYQRCNICLKPTLVEA